MRNFSGLGLGLSLVFGCLLLALLAELYYLLWWKKKRITDSNREIEEEYGNFAKELYHFICWKRATTTTATRSSLTNRPDSFTFEPHQDPELGKLEKDVHVAAAAGKPEDDGGVESELMRLHNLPGPPRFLFTIKEETREDLESDGGRSRTRSLSDLMAIAASLDTPFLTPLQSPQLKSPPLTSLTTVSNNPLFESSAAAVAESPELARLRSSPPPKFKFLRDAEEKLYRRLLVEAEKKMANNNNNNNNNSSSQENDNGNNNNNINVFTFVVGSENLPQYPSGSSQVLPLASSPSAFKVQTNSH